MKLTIATITAVATLVIAAFVIDSVAPVIAKPEVGKALTVRTMRAKVMKKPKFIGAVAKTVSRGATLQLVAIRGQWYEVSGAASGWIHKGQVVEGQVKLSSMKGASGSSASREEVELAGRGFTPEVEDNYKKRNPKLNFEHVDAIERAEIDPEQLEEFVADGRLSGGAK